LARYAARKRSDCEPKDFIEGAYSYAAREQGRQLLHGGVSPGDETLDRVALFKNI